MKHLLYSSIGDISDIKVKTSKEESSIMTDDGIIRIRRTFDEIEITADDVIEAIEELSEEEHIKLLQYLQKTYLKRNN